MERREGRMGEENKSREIGGISLKVVHPTEDEGGVGENDTPQRIKATPRR